VIQRAQPSRTPGALLLLLLAAVCSQAVAQDSLSFRRFTADPERPKALSIKQAFPYFVTVTDASTLHLDWQIADQHYLYLHGFKVSYLANQDAVGVELPLNIPDGLQLFDQFFGDVQVYYDSVTVGVDLSGIQATGGSLLVEYQGCADWGLCYPPQKDLVSLP
jgi:thiol:disulfide interchange protein DsbD